MASGDSDKWTPPESENKALKSRKLEEIRIVLLGRTGSGKSATGNTILGKEIFKSDFSPSSITVKCSKGERQIDNKKYIVTDTPGFFDTIIDNDVISNQIVDCIANILPGPSAILYIFTVTNKLTEEEWCAFTEVYKIFEKRVFQYVILMFTHADKFKDEKEFDTYISKLPDRFKTIVKVCGHRIVPFNNEAGGKENEDQLKNLFSLIDNIRCETSNQYFSDPLFEKFDSLMKKTINNINKKQGKEKVEKNYEDMIKNIENKDKFLQVLFKDEEIRERFDSPSTCNCVIL